MDAKELHQTMSMCHPNNWVITNPEIRATILRALSLLASVEGVGHNAVVPELRGIAEYFNNRSPEYQNVVLAAAARIVSDAQEKERLRAELKIANESGRQLGRLYAEEKADRKAAEARCAALRAELARVKANCKIVYWPKDGSYPIEHTMAANKDCYEMILAQMERDRAAHPKDAP